MRSYLAEERSSCGHEVLLTCFFLFFFFFTVTDVVDQQTQ